MSDLEQIEMNMNEFLKYLFRFGYEFPRVSPNTYDNFFLVIKQRVLNLFCLSLFENHCTTFYTRLKYS